MTIAACTTGRADFDTGKLTRPLSQEAGLALADELPNSSSKYKTDMLDEAYDGTF